MRNKLIVITGLFVLFLFNTAQADISVEGSRLYYGEDKNFDWVYVGKQGYWDEGKDEFIVTWEDASDIQKVIAVGRDLRIVKESSIWILYLWQRPERMRLRLIYPDRNIYHSEGKVLYER